MSDIENNKVKENNKKFSDKHKEKIKEKHICEICNGSYTYFNKYHHNKSKKHLFILNKFYNNKDDNEDKK